MDMSNATVAGPSRGLLDVIFGTGKSAEEAEADGQGFAGLMDFIKSMNGQKSEEQGAGKDRTQVGIPHGKGMAEGHAGGTPGGKAVAPELSGQQPVPASAEEIQQNERLQELSAMLGLPVSELPRAQPLPAPAKGEGQVSPEQVNTALKQKALPPLNSEELKLLQAVNTKLEQLPKLPEEKALSKAQVAVAGGAAIPVDPKDLRKPKGAEQNSLLAGGTPEKMVSTESYLQMHESVGKSPAKEVAGRSEQVANAEAPASPAAARAALTSTAVAGAGSKGLELGSRKEREPELPDGGKHKLDAASGSVLGAALAEGAKELSKHDVYLPGLDKPDQFREALLNDVGTSVALHAHKGGGEMKLVLHPDDMGEVKLKVTTKNGKVEVELTAENNDVAKVLRSGNQELESALKDQNLTLSKFEVSVSDSATTVSNLDKSSNLNDQFLSQNQQQSGFGQESASDQGRHARWDNDRGGRQGNAFAGGEYESERRSAAAPRSAARPSSRASSGRLDVVA